MLHRPFKIMLVSVLSGMSFTACSTLQNQSPATPQVLEQIKNIAASPTTEGNIAKLMKQDKNCIIEFTGYFDGGQAIEHWTFNHSGLISASSSTQYTTRASANTSTAFDIEDPAVQANFKKLQSNFSASTLAQCH